MHKVKNVVSVSPWKARMKHMFTLTVLIPNAHVMAHEPTKCILSGAYFLTGLLHSTVKNTQVARGGGYSTLAPPP